MDLQIWQFCKSRLWFQGFKTHLFVSLVFLRLRPQYHPRLKSFHFFSNFRGQLWIYLNSAGTLNRLDSKEISLCISSNSCEASNRNSWVVIPWTWLPRQDLYWLGNNEFFRGLKNDPVVTICKKYSSDLSFVTSNK